MAEMPENETGTLPGLKPVLEALGARPETVVQVFLQKGTLQGGNEADS